MIVVSPMAFSICGIVRELGFGPYAVRLVPVSGLGLMSGVVGDLAILGQTRSRRATSAKVAATSV